MSDERTLDLLEAKIEELRQLDAADGMDLSSEIAKLETKLEELRLELYANLSDWERVRIARHPKRPYALDYIDEIFDEFYELHGDRIDADDRALVAGLAKLDGRTVVVLGQQKGRSTEENKARYFGMTRPQGYRKARRVLELAERFSFPVITMIDTPGAYPGLESEEANIGGAIAESLATMSRIRVPSVAAVIGEGGPGGALAIGLADRVIMLENAIYTVITPEGAAAILWKDKERVPDAAAALNLTAQHLLELGLIDAVVSEPLGGAQKDFQTTAAALKTELNRQLGELQAVDVHKLLSDRYARYRAVGRFERIDDSEDEQKDAAIE